MKIGLHLPCLPHICIICLMEVGIIGLPQSGKSSLFEALTAIQRADALVLVIRAFKNDAVPHPQIDLDPRRDLEALSMELAFSVIAILEHRLEKLALQLKAAPSPEREAIHREQSFLLGVKAGLEKETPVRGQGLPEGGGRAPG